MSKINDVEKKYREKINSILIENGNKNELRGYINFMKDSSVRTKYTYLNIIIGFMEDKEVENLSFDDFNNYIEEVTYKENGEKKTSSFQILTYSAMKKFCEYLYASKKINENYMLYIKRPKAIESQKTTEKRYKGYLTEKEIKKVLNNIDNYNLLSFGRSTPDCWLSRDKAIIYTFLNTGIRCSALMTIEIDDLDLKERTLLVTDKGSKVKKYDLSKSLCDVLNEWVNYRKEILGKEESDILFISNRKVMMTQQLIYLTIKKYTQCIEDKNITPHKLRATYGTQLYNKTGDIYFVQDCMGHSNPKTTELYIRDKKENTKRASDIMSKLL